MTLTGDLDYDTGRCSDDQERCGRNLERCVEMVRLPGPMMDAQEFADALAAAMDGEILTDMGDDEATSAALGAVAGAAPNPPQMLIDAAVSAFAATQ
jgi:hypothetical protein